MSIRNSLQVLEKNAIVNISFYYNYHYFYHFCYYLYFVSNADFIISAKQQKHHHQQQQQQKQQQNTHANKAGNVLKVHEMQTYHFFPLDACLLL